VTRAERRSHPRRTDQLDRFAIDATSARRKCARYAVLKQTTAMRSRRACAAHDVRTEVPASCAAFGNERR